MFSHFEYRRTRDEILKQPPAVDDAHGHGQLGRHIGDVAIKELDPGVLSARLVSWLHGGREKESVQLEGQPDGEHEHHRFSFEEAQAGLTQLYDRVEQSFGSLFDVLEIEATWPRFIPLAEKRKMYRFSAFPTEADGRPAQFPPHLEAIPRADEVPAARIFDRLALLETQGLVEGFVPRTPLQSGLRWLLRELDGDVHAAAEPAAPTMAAMEEYNRRHRKTGTDIEQGRNIGLLEDWYSDRRFADQAFTGPDPTAIERCPEDLLHEFVDVAERDGEEYWAGRLREVAPEELFVMDFRYLREAIGAAPEEELVRPGAEGKDGEEEEGKNGVKEKNSSSSSSSSSTNGVTNGKNGVEEKNSSSSSSTNGVTNGITNGVTNWACAAVSLFHLEDNGQLHPVAIVLDYRRAMRSSVTLFNRAPRAMPPADDARDIPCQEGDWPWRYAKTCAQVAAWTRHEVGAHLTRAHFVEEAVIVATHRAVPMDHVVFRLLEPHWYKTLSLNAAARATLVPAVIEPILGLTGDQLYRYIRHEFESVDYVQGYVPNDLRRRGFPDTLAGLAASPRYRNYAYAKDMLGMWLVIRRYVRGMLLAHYGRGRRRDDHDDHDHDHDHDALADAQVAADPHLAAWTKEVREGARIATFPDIRTLDGLTDVVTMSIHIAAPFHTAVNYLQNFYQAFVPSRPPSLSTPLPRSLDELRAYREIDLVRALPVGDRRQWLLAVQVPWLLSFKVGAERNLVAFARTQWGLHAGGSREDKIVREVSARLYDDLNALSAEVARVSRGMDVGSIPYTVLDPRSTAVSILI